MHSYILSSDMDVVFDEFKPTVPTVMDHIWGFFSGVRQRGVQSTEKMLRTGTIVTGIGELVYTNDGSLRLQPPPKAPFYLTNMQVTSLVKKLDSSKRNYRFMCIIFGTAGIVLSVMIFRKYWMYRKQLVEDQQRKKQIEESRRNRRRQMREENVPESQLCVVCKTNPIEVNYIYFYNI